MILPGLVGFRLCSLDNEELAKRVTEGLNEMYDIGQIPSRYIPAQPDRDFDLLVGELIVRFTELTENKVKLPLQGVECTHTDGEGACDECKRKAFNQFQESKK